MGLRCPVCDGPLPPTRETGTLPGERAADTESVVVRPATGGRFPGNGGTGRRRTQAFL